jgi:hypothetical protein
LQALVNRVFQVLQVQQEQLEPKEQQVLLERQVRIQLCLDLLVLQAQRVLLVLLGRQVQIQLCLDLLVLQVQLVLLAQLEQVVLSVLQELLDRKAL